MYVIVMAGKAFGPFKTLWECGEYGLEDMDSNEWVAVEFIQVNPLNG